MVERGLGAGCRQQVACAHPPFLSPLKSLWGDLLRAPFEYHCGKGNPCILSWAVQSGTPIQDCMFDCMITNATPHMAIRVLWQTEMDFSKRWPRQNKSFGQCFLSLAFLWYFLRICISLLILLICSCMLFYCIADSLCYTAEISTTL